MMPPEPALSELRTLFGDRMSAAASVLAEHAQSESLITAGTPDAVVFPRSTEEVAALARWSAGHRVPLIGWGAGTSLEGHALALAGGVAVDFREMAAVLEVRAEDRLARVQPGITREALNHDLRTTGLMFSVDPGANASIGGMAATRASGTTAVRYGTMRDNVRGLEVVLADGRVIRTGTGAPKSSAGYDLTALFVGSEGTLGLITELVLKLHGQPEAVMTAVATFPSVVEAVDCVIATMQMGLAPARIEFLDTETVAACNAYSRLNLPPAPQLLVEFHGHPEGVSEDTRRFRELAQEFAAEGLQEAARQEDRSRLWALAQAVEETQADIARSGIPGPILGHVGDGNFHAILLVDPARAHEVETAKGLAARMAERSLRLGGTITGEHGVGFGKLPLMAGEHGPAWEVMGSLKRALDPLGLMNPGKVVPGSDVPQK
jgi:D-lactate dehydrogenase (cytochrome)